jgi:hypothetical protein
MTSDQDLNDYLNDLLDAARQRSSVSDIERYKRALKKLAEQTGGKPLHVYNNIKHKIVVEEIT